MSKLLEEMLAINARYVENFGERAKLSVFPKKKVAVLMCMDSRMEAHEFAGLGDGDAHIIRNAGGRATDDAIRSLVVSYKLLGTEEFVVIHHTDCGLEKVTDLQMRELLASSLETAERSENGFVDVGKGPGSRDGQYIEWLAFTDGEQAVRDDVTRLRNHALIPSRINISGFILDTRTGKLTQIE